MAGVGGGLGAGWEEVGGRGKGNSKRKRVREKSKLPSDPPVDQNISSAP